MQWILVFMGGGLGSILRFGLSKVIIYSKYPLAVSTLVSNILACLILGITLALLGSKALHHHYYILVVTGVCGGFSTFSTFSYETLKMWQQGEVLWAITNVLVSVAGCMWVVYLGLKFVR